LEKERETKSKELWARLESDYPSLFQVLKKRGQNPPLEYILDVLPKDATYLSKFSEFVFLTDKGILKYDTTILNPRIKGHEIIPVHQITGIETEVPKGGEDYALWWVTLTRANNVDRLLSTDTAEVVTDFVNQVKLMLEGSNRENPASKKIESPKDRILALKQLLDEGLISNEEFETKRASILSEM